MTKHLIARITQAMIRDWKTVSSETQNDAVYERKITKLLWW